MYSYSFMKQWIIIEMQGVVEFKNGKNVQLEKLGTLQIENVLKHHNYILSLEYSNFDNRNS